jgi:hypothetical protein
MIRKQGFHTEGARRIRIYRGSGENSQRDKIHAAFYGSLDKP